MGLRILAVNWQDRKNPLAGGAEIHLQEILTRLGRWGHDVTLFCSSFPGSAPEEEYDNQKIIRRGQRFTFNWVVPCRLRKLVARKSFDIIIEDINKIPFYIPLYVKSPLLVVVPHLFATTVFQEINPVLASYIYLMERPVSRIYRRFPWMVISESTKSDLVKRGIPAGQISVIHCGIDHDLYSTGAEVQDRFEQPTIVYLGRLKKYKCVDHIFQAAAGLPSAVGDWRIVVIGDGDDLPRLRREAARVGVDKRVTFTGFVDQATKVDYLRRAHVAVCPSLKEGWGLTNIEANACGTPVIAADVPGLRDSVRDGETGLLYPHGAIPALTDCLNRVLTDETLWNNLITGGLSWSATFQWDAAAKQTEALLAETVRDA